MNVMPLTKHDKSVLKKEIYKKLIEFSILAGLFVVTSLLLLFINFVVESNINDETEFKKTVFFFLVFGLGLSTALFLPAPFKTYLDIRKGEKRKCKGRVQKVQFQNVPAKSIYPIVRWKIWLQTEEQTMVLKSPYWFNRQIYYGIYTNQFKNKGQAAFTKKMYSYLNSITELEYAPHCKIILRIAEMGVKS